MIRSTEQLLALPLDERRTVAVVPEWALHEIEQQAPADRAKRLLKRVAGGLGGAAAGGAGGAAAAGGLGLIGAEAGAAAAGAAAAPIVLPALALGAAGLGVATLLSRGKNSLTFGVQVISAATARGLTFAEGPCEVGRVYQAHPMVHGRYLPMVDYARVVLQERARETETFLLSCGASRIEMTVEYGEDLSTTADVGHKDPRGGFAGKLHAKRKESTRRRTVLEAPGRLVPDQIEPSQWTWLPIEPEWPEIHRRRSQAGITSYELTTDLVDDRSHDLEAVVKLPGVNSQAHANVKRLDKTMWKWKVTFPPQTNA